MELMDMTLRDIYKEYYKACKDIAIEALKIENEDERNDLVYQAVDNSGWIIYTFRAELVSLLSENRDAVNECHDEKQDIEVVAYLAMVADVKDFLDNDYFIEEQTKEKVA